MDGLAVRAPVFVRLESGLTNGLALCHGDFRKIHFGVFLIRGFYLNNDKWFTAFRCELTTTRKDLCQVLVL